MTERWRAAAQSLAAPALAVACLVVCLTTLASCATPTNAAMRAAPATRAPVRTTASIKLAAPPQITAGSAMLYDLTTGKTLYTLNPDNEVPMASTTKIMTAVVALTFGNLDQPITVGADAVALDNQGTSICGLVLGETLTLREMLYCLMLPSGDDAAIAIADGVGGSQQGFVSLMNLETAMLGLGHTHYANPHGLDQPGHYTSARDLVKLAAYALSSPTFANIVATPTMVLPANATHHEYILTNTNELLAGQPFAYTGAVGVKTGYTGGAGYCLVFAATRPQGTLLGVVLGEPVYDARFTDASTLLNWGFSQVGAPAVAVTPQATATAAG